MSDALKAKIAFAMAIAIATAIALVAAFALAALPTDEAHAASAARVQAAASSDLQVGTTAMPDKHAKEVKSSKVKTQSAVYRAKVYRNNTNNCVLWARSQVPSLPYGLTYFSAKKRICNLSSSATPHVGDVAVMQSSSVYGHVGVVVGVSGSRITIRESNWVKGWITQATGTRSQLRIYGYFCPKKGSAHKASKAGSAMASLKGDPRGCFDEAQGSKRKVRVRGWCFDGDSVKTSLNVHVYIGAPAGQGEGHVILANQYRPDVSNAYRGYGNVGSYHGFDSWISTCKRGKVKVYVYAINVGSGKNNTYLGCKTVNITG